MLENFAITCVILLLLAIIRNRISLPTIKDSATKSTIIFRILFQTVMLAFGVIAIINNASS